MSDLEAQPTMAAMIVGRSVTLSPDEQMDIARWAVMKSMAFDFDESQGEAIPQSERVALMEQCRANLPLDLAGWRVALGQYVGTDYDNPFLQRVRYHIGSGVFAQATTLRLGELAIATHSGVHQLDGYAEAVESVDCNTALKTIYPHEGPIDWPPRVMIHDALMDRIVHRMRLPRELGEKHPVLQKAAVEGEKAGLAREWPPREDARSRR